MDIIASAVGDITDAPVASCYSPLVRMHWKAFADLATSDASGWVGENEARSETPKIGEYRIPVHEQYARPRAPKAA